MIKIYGATDFTVMPWKNKLGSTLQFLIEPHHAQFPGDLFSWRLSSAPILTDGEFSKFPGYLRALMVTEGKGLKLNQTFLKPLEAHYFSGDETTHAELTSGPVQDLGIIYDAKKLKVKLSALTLLKDETQTLHLKNSETVLFYALKGNGEIEAEEMREGEVARIEDTDFVRLQSLVQSWVWVCVQIEKIQP